MASDYIPPVNTRDTATAAMHVDMERLRVISNNLTNAGTSGFRREIVNAQPFADALSAAGALPVASTSSSFDMRSGPLRATGRALDVAVNGAGFIEVMSDKGLTYTRDGALHVDGQGRLMTSAGYAVQGDGGEIRGNSEDLQIQPNGDVKQGDRVLGRIRVVHFATPNLQPVGNGLYAAKGAPLPPESDTAAVLKVRHLESSNVSAAAEMLQMTETVRHLEALQKVMQSLDDSMEKAIRKFGDL